VKQFGFAPAPTGHFKQEGKLIVEQWKPYGIFQ
jgi:hypothetical protein